MGAGLESGRPSVTRGGLKIGEIPNVQDTARQGVEAALNTPKMPLSQARVLLAEDENYLVDMLIDTLSFLGVDTQNNVQVVTSGLEMQAKIKEGGVFDLLLSDNHMPGCNGSDAIETLTSLRLIDPKKTFIVMQTGRPELLLPRFEKIGAHRILGKPYDISTLRQVLSERFS